MDSKIPEFCIENCESLWDDAVKKTKIGEEYDIYPTTNDQCEHEGGIVYSHDALVALGYHVRRYVVVDQCVDCNGEYGEQDFKFVCPNS